MIIKIKIGNCSDRFFFITTSLFIKYCGAECQTSIRYVKYGLEVTDKLFEGHR